MKTILVSGASGIVGYGILKSLKNKGYRLIGTTIYSESAANCFSDIFELAPKTTDANYIDWLIDTIQKNKIDMIIPGIEDDMILWNQKRDLLSKFTYPLLNTSELIELCSDKWQFYKKLSENQSPYRIDTTLTQDFEELKARFGIPFLLKPRRGFASKGIIKVENQEIFEIHKDRIGSILMAQPIIGDSEHEYTVSAFFDKDSQLCAYQQLRRKLSQTGFTEIAETVNLENIETTLMDLAKIFRPIGPTNFQFRQDINGLKLLEINPRISSSTSIRTAFGYNEALMAIQYFLEQQKQTKTKLKSGQAIRYVEDYILFD